jgi:hypothetical protein
VVSKALPIIWKVGVPNTEPNYNFITRIVAIPHINGSPLAPIDSAYLKVDSTTLDIYAEFDVQGLVNAHFIDPTNKSDTIPTNEAETAFSCYFAGNGNIHCAVYLELQTYYDDGTGEQLDFGLDTDTQEIFAFVLMPQEQESQRFLPYLFGAGMQPLTYQYLVNAGTPSSPLPPQKGGLRLKYSDMGYFLSLMWDGGAGAAALTVTLRNSVTQNWYGTGVYHYDTAFPTHKDTLTVSIAPQNLRSLPNAGWHFTSPSPNFLANLNNPNAGWDVVRILISLPISIGGGAYVYIPLVNFYYEVDFDTACFAPLYFQNTLGGFDAVAIECCKVVGEFETNPVVVKTPRSFDYLQPVWDRRTNPMQGGFSVVKSERTTRYTIGDIPIHSIEMHRIWAQLKMSREIYTNQNFFKEQAYTRVYPSFYKLNPEKQKMEYRFRNSVPDFSMVVSPANDFKTI